MLMHVNLYNNIAIKSFQNVEPSNLHVPAAHVVRTGGDQFRGGVRPQHLGRGSRHQFAETHQEVDVCKYRYKTLLILANKNRLFSYKIYKHII